MFLKTNLIHTRALIEHNSSGRWSIGSKTKKMPNLLSNLMDPKFQPKPNFEHCLVKLEYLFFRTYRMILWVMNLFFACSKFNSISTIDLFNFCNLLNKVFGFWVEDQVMLLNKASIKQIFSHWKFHTYPTSHSKVMA